jgi:hypothetical protein
MPVLAQDGDNIGAVAGIVQKGASRSVTHLLLGQIPPTADYRLIPVGVLDRLEGECVYVRATRQQVAALSMYQADS